MIIIGRTFIISAFFRIPSLIDIFHKCKIIIEHKAHYRTIYKYKNAFMRAESSMENAFQGSPDTLCIKSIDPTNSIKCLSEIYPNVSKNLTPITISGLIPEEFIY